MNKSIKLQTSAILHVPLNKHDKDFTFIVNGESFHTSKFVADLLSQKVSNYHSIDPTINEITIKTQTIGNFDHFLKLQNFEERTFSEEESKFIFEVMKQLETSQIEMNENRCEITNDNIVDLLLKDEKFQETFSKNYEEEVEFVSSNFSKILQIQKEKLKTLSISTIESIIINPNLQLENEDELLNFINELYKESSEYSILYEYVYFSNVESNTIEEFINVFDVNDLNQSTWISISNRLKEEINKKTNKDNNKRYKSDKFTEFESGKDFKGIFNFLRNNSNINDEVNITASSVRGGDLKKLIQSEKHDNEFYTEPLSNSWVCVEFIKRKVIPTHYTIRSNDWSANSEHPKSWVFEGSEDSKRWTKLDSQTDCSYLNGNKFFHTFPIHNNNKSFKYFRIYQTGKDWNGYDNLCFNCIELYGKFTS